MEINVPVIENANVWGLVGLKKGEKRAPQNVLNALHKTVKPIAAPDSISDARTARRLAFRGVKRQLTLWKGPVCRNRLADQLVFPLNDKSLCVSDSSQIQEKCDIHVSETKRNSTTLAGKLYNALYREHSVSKNKTDVPDSKIREKLLESVALRQKERYLLARAAAKNKKRNKIKSKTFHRHLKKRTMKQFEAEMEQMRQNDPRAFAERIFRSELNRAKERASLRHREGSKFARLQKLRAKYDVEARNAVAEMHERSKELTKQTNANELSESEVSDIDVTSESECESDETELSEAEDDNSETSDNNLDSLMWWCKPNDTEVKRTSKATKTKSLVLSTLAAETMLDLCPKEKTETSNRSSLQSEKLDNLDPTTDMSYQAFEENAAVDVGIPEQFAKEKSEAVDEETPKDLDTFVPGWNSWTGPGLEEQDEQRRKNRRIPAPKVKREDSDKDHVLIRHRVNSEFRQHLVKSIPFPYNTPEQFESFIVQPVSREWLTEKSHRERTRPKVTVQSGRIIRPISKSVALLRDKDVERFTKRTKHV